ncbi:MAG: ABC transporter permease [Thermoanaerobaculales bacterium]|jgi:putative ABC transport system permease protein|nr:ABC transporter permease [Thermoanaerobaculales bacterium]
MAIPISYNIRSVGARWATAVVSVLGIAGTVGVFLAMLAMARGFQATLVSSGSPDNVIVLRAGADSEMTSAVSQDQVRILSDEPQIARADDGAPLVSPEVVVIGAFPLATTGTDANVQIRGVHERVLEVRPTVTIVEGRFFEPGLTELVVGRNAVTSYRGLSLGSTVEIGGEDWKVVGVFSSGGSAFDSEVWCDANLLNQTFKRGSGVYQSVTARLGSRDGFNALKDALTTDPRMTVDVAREQAYYAKQSQAVSMLIKALGFLVAFVMAIGAVFGALNTMYSAVAARAREIATLRALGFGGFSVLTSFVLESVLIALVGGALGCLAVLPLNGFTAGTMNWQTFSHLAFAFKVTPSLMLWGLGFAALMGLVGGLLPALRAARMPVAAALREL